jgi:tetratricopeptide (TPR) repeat protein
VGYFAYYLVWIGLSFALRYPALAVFALAFWFLRDRLPDPVKWARGYSLARKLEQQVALNPANVTARRDLARTYLEGFRPGRALEFLNEARARRPDDAELLFLTGLAQARLKRHEEAVKSLISAVQMDGNVGREELYLRAGDSLVALERYPDARDAFEHATEANSSTLEGFVKLARVFKKLGMREEATRAIDEAQKTYRTLPGYMRRRQLGWFLRAKIESF